MTDNDKTMIEIVDAATDAVIVCDTLAHCILCDAGIKEERDDIRTALDRGETYSLGGGAAAHFIIRLAPEAAAAYAQ